MHYFENPKIYFLCKLMGSISRRQPFVFITGSDLVIATRLHQTKGLPEIVARFKSTELESFRSGPNQTVIFSKGQKEEDTVTMCTKAREGSNHNLNCTHSARKPADPGWPPAVRCVAGICLCDGGSGHVLFYKPQLTRLWSRNGKSTCQAC